MGNQRGEIVTGVMVVMMAVMMIFGGMRLMHGEHRHGGDHTGNAQTNKHHDEGMQHMRNSEGEQPAIPDQEEKK